MKTLIIYKSKWGATEQYAKWLAEDLTGSILKSVDDVQEQDLNDADLIILGSRTYIGQIQIVSFIKKHWHILKTKKLYLFSVGIIPWEKPDAKKAFEAIPEEIRSSLLGHRKLPGRIDMAKLNFLQKMMVKAQKSGNVDKVDRKELEVVKEDLKKLLT